MKINVREILIEEEKMRVEKKIHGRLLNVSTGESQKFWEYMKYLANGGRVKKWWEFWK